MEGELDVPSDALTCRSGNQINQVEILTNAVQMENQQLRNKLRKIQVNPVSKSMV
jgi:hypothetical protein